MVLLENSLETKAEPSASFGRNLEFSTQEIVDLYHNATSPSDLAALIDNIDRNISKLDSYLSQYIKINSKRHQNHLDTIDLARVNKLSNSILSASQLNSIFESANSLGTSLTTRIKSLDVEIENVNSTLSFVNDINTLKTNINQANYAIENGDYKTAALCVNRILLLDSVVVNGQFASAVIPLQDLPHLPAEILKIWIDKLTTTFQQKFNEAASVKNIEEITKFFQLFPLINKKDVGLSCYSNFIRQIIIENSKSLISSIPVTDPSPLVFSSASIQLFENISLMLSRHAPLIKKFYDNSLIGADVGIDGGSFVNDSSISDGDSNTSSVIFVIDKIQSEIDTQISIITDTLYDNLKIDKLIHDIRLYTYPLLTKRFQQLQGMEVSDPTFSEELVSVVQVGDIVHEFSSIFHHWSLYCKFITIKYLIDKHDEFIEIPVLIKSSQFNKKIKDKYLPAFENLSTFYFRRSIEKAISIEEIPSLDPYLQTKSNNSSDISCSSVIEDVTLILSNSLRGVIESSIVPTVKRFISSSYEVIKNDLINSFFIKNLNDNSPRYNQSLSILSPENDTKSPSISRTGTPEPSSLSFLKGASSALGNVVTTQTAITSNNPKVVKFAIYLNSVAIGQEYFTKVFEKFIKDESYLKNTFPFGKDHEIVKLILTNDFIDPFNQVTSKIISDSLLNLYNQSFKTKILMMINEFIPDSADSNYVIYTSNEQDSNEAYSRLVNSWQSIIVPYQRVFHKTLIAKLLRLLMVNISNVIEMKLNTVLQKYKINELGSIKLERDVSYLINEVCEDNYHLREKFVRLTQIVLLVGMEDDEYEESIKHVNQSNTDEFDETLGINWVLTPLERKKIRSYRV